MTALTPEKLAELQRLLDVVRDGSPLPWRRIGSRVDDAERFKVAECLLDQDAILIAAAVNALPALLDAAAERERMREGRDDSPRDEDGWATPGQMWAMLLDSPLNERMALLRAALRAMDAEHRCIVGFHHEAVQQRDALADQP